MADDVIRTFIAVDLPPHVLDALGQISSQLQEKLPDTPVRWVNNEKMHLTLKFMGDISTENIGMVKKILQTEASKRQVMEIGMKEPISDTGCLQMHHYLLLQTGFAIVPLWITSNKSIPSTPY